MAIFAIPGLMPSGHPKNTSRRTANADGSLELRVFTVDAETIPPKVHFKIADGGGFVIVQDLTGACLFTETSNTTIVGVIRIDAGVLPVGLLTMHVECVYLDEPSEYVDFDIEVPASPFHVESTLDFI